MESKNESKNRISSKKMVSVRNLWSEVSSASVYNKKFSDVKQLNLLQRNPYRTCLPKKTLQTLWGKRLIATLFFFFLQRNLSSWLIDYESLEMSHCH